MNALKPRALFHVLVMSEESTPRPRGHRDGLRAVAARDRCWPTIRRTHGRSCRPC
jgi:hypothetical protein